VVDVVEDVLLVDVADGTVGLVAERVGLAGGDVVADVVWRRRSGMTVDTASKSRIQRSAAWSRRQVLGRWLFEFVDGVGPRSKGRPANVSPRSKASPSRFVVPVVVLRELVVLGEFPVRSPEAGNADDDADVLAPGLFEEQFGRALAEHVEDDLYRLDAGVLDGLQGLLDLLDADTVVGYLPFFLQPVERLEGLGLVVRVVGRAVEPDKFQRLLAEVLPRAVDERRG